MSITASAIDNTGRTLTNKVGVPPSHGYGARYLFRFFATTTTTTLKFLDTSTATDAVDILLDAVEVVRLNSHVQIAVSEVAVCWQTVTNAQYQAQYRSEATTNSWSNLGTVLQGNGSQMCLPDKIQGYQHRIYRVLTLP